MTKAPPYRLTAENRRIFFGIMLPALAEIIISHLFGMVDTMMLGNTPDSAAAIAAVGMVSAPNNFVVCVFTNFCIGITAAIAFYSGMGEPDKAAAAARQSMVLSAAVGILMTVTMTVGAPLVIDLLGAGEDVREYAIRYFRLIALGYFFQLVTINITACLRGVGITRYPMVYNLIASGANVVMNYLLIYGHFGFPAMGVDGAALATTLSKLIAFVIAVVLICRAKTAVRPDFRLNFFRFWLPGRGQDREVISRILPVGITAAMEQVILQGGAVLTTRIISVLPTVHYAAYLISANVEGLAWSPGQACNAASTTLSGRSLGEGKPDKARAYALYIWFWSLGMAAAVMVLFLTMGRPIASLYTPEAAAAVLAGRLIMQAAVGMPGIATHLSLAGSLRGAGETRAPLIVSLCSLWICRVLGSWLCLYVLDLGVEAVRLCVSLDQLVRGAIVTGAFFRYFRRR